MHQLLEQYFKLVESDLLLLGEKCVFIETFTVLSHFQTVEDQDSLFSKLLAEVKSLRDATVKRYLFLQIFEVRLFAA